jgi:hypothetical protein
MDGAAAAPAPAASGGGADRRGGAGDDRDDDRGADWRLLVEDWNFPEELARQFQACGIARCLIKLAESGFEITEGDPLLVGVVDVDNPESLAYASRGNYGLSPGTPGHRAWPGGSPPEAGAPLPAGAVAAPPRALASFLRSMPGVFDKAGDGAAGMVFHVENLGRLHEIPPRLQGTHQFARLGPWVAENIGSGAVEQAELVRFYTLDSMKSPPGAYRASRGPPSSLAAGQGARAGRGQLGQGEN